MLSFSANMDDYEARTIGSIDQTGKEGAWIMAEEKKTVFAQEAENVKETSETVKEEVKEVSATWAQEIIEDLDDFIESQGIYLRQ